MCSCEDRARAGGRRKCGAAAAGGRALQLDCRACQQGHRQAGAWWSVMLLVWWRGDSCRDRWTRVLAVVLICCCSAACDNCGWRCMRGRFAGGHAPSLSASPVAGACLLQNLCTLNSAATCPRHRCRCMACEHSASRSPWTSKTSPTCPRASTTESGDQLDHVQQGMPSCKLAMVGRSAGPRSLQRFYFFRRLQWICSYAI